MPYSVRGTKIHLNTSHVFIYHIFDGTTFKWFADLNTSHVFIYPWLNSPSMPAIAFKYISCFYLSFITPPPKYSHSYLNTSHVFIYPVRVR